MDNSINFEQSVKRLQEIVTSLEGGKLSLEESIALYNEGTQISQKCKEDLLNARLTVRTINGDNSEVMDND